MTYDFRCMYPLSKVARMLIFRKGTEDNVPITIL